MSSRGLLMKFPPELETVAPGEYRSQKSADRRMATGAARPNRKKIMAPTDTQKGALTSIGLLIEGLGFAQ